MDSSVHASWRAYVMIHTRNSFIHAMIRIRNSVIHAVTKSSWNPGRLSSSSWFPYSHRFHITPPQFREPYKTSLWEKYISACMDLHWTLTGPSLDPIKHAIICVRMQTYMLWYMREIQVFMLWYMYECRYTYYNTCTKFRYTCYDTSTKFTYTCCDKVGHESNCPEFILLVFLLSSLSHHAATV